MAFVPYSGNELPNLVNVTKRMDPDGSIAMIGELLQQFNPILEDIPLVEANNSTSHRITVRADLPDPTWRKLNYGVRPTKSKTEQVDDTIGMLEDYGEVDKTSGSSIVYRDVSAPIFNQIFRNNILPGTAVNITANITDNKAISAINITVFCPNGTTFDGFMELSAGLYSFTNLTLVTAGEYNVTYRENDSSGNVNITTDWFEVEDTFTWR